MHFPSTGGDFSKTDSGRMSKKAWLPVLREAGLLVLISALLAFGVNALRSDGLSLLRSAARTADGKQDPRVDIERAAALFHSRQAVFVDARPREDFSAAHIPGAVSLPLADVDAAMQDFVVQTDPGAMVIVYCGGPECHLAEQLAEKIRSWGYRHVFPMPAGLDGWQAKGLPVG